MATAWVGYDQPSTLGKREYGGTAALPLWINFMRDALKDTPETPVLKPGGIIQLRIDAATGMRASAGSGNTIYEYFSSDKTPGYGASAGYSGGKSTEDIF